MEVGTGVWYEASRSKMLPWPAHPIYSLCLLKSSATDHTRKTPSGTVAELCLTCWAAERQAQDWASCSAKICDGQAVMPAGMQSTMSW